MIWKFGKEKLKEAEAKLDKLSKEDITNGAKEVTGAVLENGVEIVKGDIFGIVNDVLLKIAFIVTFVALIIAGGCVVTSITVDKLTKDEPTEVQSKIIK